MSRKIEKKKSPPPISLRLSDEERARLEHAAAGMSLSAYIRKCVFGEKATIRKVRTRAPVQNEEALARVLGLLGQSRIANNLNQLAKDANCGVLMFNKETEAKIDDAYEHVIAMRGELIHALGLKEEDKP